MAKENDPKSRDVTDSFAFSNEPGIEPDGPTFEGERGGMSAPQYPSRPGKDYSNKRTPGIDEPYKPQPRKRRVYGLCEDVEAI